MTPSAPSLHPTAPALTSIANSAGSSSTPACWRGVRRAQPLLERLKFLAIFSSNLDEFYMVRVAGLRRQVAARVSVDAPDGLTPREQLDAIEAEVARLSTAAARCLTTCCSPRSRAMACASCR